MCEALCLSRDRILQIGSYRLHKVQSEKLCSTLYLGVQAVKELLATIILQFRLYRVDAGILHSIYGLSSKHRLPENCSCDQLFTYVLLLFHYVLVWG